MLNHYIQVIHTSRCARGLAMRSTDNVLPEYLDAAARRRLRHIYIKARPLKHEAFLDKSCFPRFACAPLLGLKAHGEGPIPYKTYGD